MTNIIECYEIKSIYHSDTTDYRETDIVPVNDFPQWEADHADELNAPCVAGRRDIISKELVKAKAVTNYEKI